MATRAASAPSDANGAGAVAGPADMLPGSDGMERLWAVTGGGDEDDGDEDGNDGDDGWDDVDEDDVDEDDGDDDGGDELLLQTPILLQELIDKVYIKPTTNHPGSSRLIGRVSFCYSLSVQYIAFNQLIAQFSISSQFGG